MTRAAALSASAIVAAMMFSAQPIPVRTLTARDAEFAEPFTWVDGVRELGDGRVIVVDSHDRLIHLVDFASATRARVGRQGQGPGEYQSPMRLFALPGDSSMVYDLAMRSANVITPHATMPGVLPAPPGSGGPVALSDRSGTDSRGRIYSEVRLNRQSGNGDTVGIERVDRGTGNRDTVAFVSVHVVSSLLAPRPSGPQPGRAGGMGGMGAAERAGGVLPFMSRDQWAVAPDGRVAVVSVEPYHVAFYDQNGARRVSPPIATDRIPVGEALKTAWRAEHHQLVPGLVYSGGTVVAQMLPPSYTEPTAWPEYLPAILDRAVWYAPDGVLWVQRTTAADAPATFDLIDATGRVSQRVVLPKQTRLVGFGVSSVYVVRIDADDLEYLQRYRLPGALGGAG